MYKTQFDPEGILDEPHFQLTILRSNEYGNEKEAAKCWT